MCVYSRVLVICSIIIMGGSPISTVHGGLDLNLRYFCALFKAISTARFSNVNALFLLLRDPSTICLISPLRIKGGMLLLFIQLVDARIVSGFYSSTSYYIVMC